MIQNPQFLRDKVLVFCQMGKSRYDCSLESPYNAVKAELGRDIKFLTKWRALAKSLLAAVLLDCEVYFSAKPKLNEFVKC